MFEYLEMGATPSPVQRKTRTIQRTPYTPAQKTVEARRNSGQKTKDRQRAKRAAHAGCTSACPKSKPSTSQTKPTSVQGSCDAMGDVENSDAIQNIFGRLTEMVSPRKSKHDEQLWDYIWKHVESPDTASAMTAGASSPCQSTRKQVEESKARGTHPAASPKEAGSAIELHQRCSQQQQRKDQHVDLAERKKEDLALMRTRINGKQPAPLAYAIFSVARGHYDVLGIRRTATPNEVHAAYRRQILRTHPDKGGDPSEFHRVVSAYAELSDASRRAAYDRSLDLFGRKDGTTLAEPVTETKWVRVATQTSSDDRSCIGAARAAHIKLLASSPQAWPWLLAKVQKSVLEGLRDILKGKKLLLVTEENKAHMRKGEIKSNSGRKHTGITQTKSGYKIEVCWSSFYVSTGFTKSISQAVDWQIALSRTRSKAALRMRENSSLGPLTGDELLQLFQEEPSLDLAFHSVIKVGSSRRKKVVSPAIQDLNMAKDFHKRLVSFVGARKSEQVLQQEKKRIEKEAREGRLVRKACENQMLVAVSYELRLRAARSAESDCSKQSKKRKRDSGGSRVDMNCADVTSLAVVPAESFKPHRRIRGKMPVMVLALAQQDEIGYMQVHQELN